MFDQQFQSLIDQGRPTGKVVAVHDFIITVRGLAPIGANALVLFDNGSQGLVREVKGDDVLILNLGIEAMVPGGMAVLYSEQLVTAVGKDLIGRVVSASGRPLDGKGALALSETWPVFYDAPGLIERDELDTQLETGVTLVDTLFPIVLGQRIALLGDSKTGKSSLLLQIAQNQMNRQRVVIYAMVAKRPNEIDAAVSQLAKSGALAHTVVVATSVFDSLVESYLAPYIACSIGEYFWHQGVDAIVLYDDFSNHAQVYREISLQAGANPGRDSYPGDLFYRHSSLLERAGKLKTNGKTLTAIPAVLTPSNDVTAYLPTNIISITDGQIVFDTEVMRSGQRPAVNTGLSVSRVGGRAQTTNQKSIASQIFQLMGSYRDAQEFSHFASEMSEEAQRSLTLGERILGAFKQTASELYPLAAQQVLLEAALKAEPTQTLNLGALKQWTRQQNLDLHLPDTNPEGYKQFIQQVIAAHLINEQPKPAENEAPSPEAKPAEEGK